MTLWHVVIRWGALASAAWSLFTAGCGGGASTGVGQDTGGTSVQDAVSADNGSASCRCGDGKCDPVCGETLATCPLDCSKAVCGDGECSPGEGPIACPVDCCGGCGDGRCTGYQCGENGTTCPKDCGTACGNKTCEPGESPVSCPEDCRWKACGNGVCEPEDGGPADCPQDCGTTCGNCTCEKGEDWLTCPVDCGYCGDGVCSDCAGLNEGSKTCPADCAVVPDANYPDVAEPGAADAADPGPSDVIDAADGADTPDVPSIPCNLPLKCQDGKCWCPSTTTVLPGGPYRSQCSRRTAIAMDSGGLPWIAFATDPANVGDINESRIRVIHCTNRECLGSPDVDVLVEGASGCYPFAMDLVDSGLPVVAAFHPALNGGALFRCTSAGCSKWTASLFDAGWGYTRRPLLVIKGSVATMVYGFPPTINVCAPGCDPADGTTLGNWPPCSCYPPPCDPNMVGRLGSDGFLVSFISGICVSGVAVLKCSDESCTSGSMVQKTLEDVGMPPLAATIGNDGNPVVAFWGGGGVRVARCKDASCATVAAHTIASTGVYDLAIHVFGDGVSLDGTDVSGFPFVVYSDASVYTMAWCADADCTAILRATPLGDRSAGFDALMSVGAIDPPVLVYPRAVDLVDPEGTSYTGYEYLLLRCGDASCRK